MTRIKSLVTTRHGSHLYGMAHAESDLDLYTVYTYYNKRYRPRKQVSRVIDIESDQFRISLDKFKDYVLSGVPQACEALFAPEEAWTEHHQDWFDIRDNIVTEMQGSLADILETYRRTAINFMRKDDFKKNRHAFRLVHNARELKDSGAINPRLSEGVVDNLTRLAELPYSFRTDEFKEQLFECFG